MAHLTDLVRQQTAAVMAQAELVQINQAAIADYAAMLLKQYALITKVDITHHYVSHESPEGTAAYMLALDSVNFGSGYFGIAKELDIPLEYMNVAAALKGAFTRGEFNTAEKWQRITAADCHALFAIPADRSEALDQLMTHFAAHLQASGNIIASEYGGRVLNLLAAAENSAARLVDIVGGWPHFRDVAVYKGAEVGFFKRAQIFAADIFLAFDGAAPAAFNDMAALTCFSDNMVPHVLRHDGIISYAPALAAQIDNGVEIAAGSAAEIEIRAAAIHAVGIIRAAASTLGHTVTDVNLDHIIWNRGYESGIYAKPSHKTRTTWY